MEESLIVLLGLPFKIGVAYVLTKLLPTRHPLLFISIMSLEVIITTAFVFNVGMTVDPSEGILYDAGRLIGLAVMIVCNIVTPFVLYKGAWLFRLLVVVMANVLIQIGVFIEEGLFSLMTGPVSADTLVYIEVVKTHMFEYILCVLAAFVVQVWALLILRSFLIRCAGKSSRGAWLFIAIPLSQMLLLFFAGLASAMFDAGFSYNAGMCAFGLMYLVLDGFILSSLEKYEKKRLSDARAEFLREQLEVYLPHYKKVVQEVGAVARARHDLRSQMQVAFSLAEDGNIARARDHVDAMLYRIAGKGCIENESAE